MLQPLKRLRSDSWLTRKQLDDFIEVVEALGAAPRRIQHSRLPTMLQELVLAIGIPLLLLLIAVLALERWADQRPPWLQRLSQRPSVLWNIEFGLIIGL